MTNQTGRPVTHAITRRSRPANASVEARAPWAGSAALDLAYVAAGRYDGFFEIGLAPWDVAAGSLMVTEAGGLIGDFAGDAKHVFAEEVVAGTPKVFAQLLALLRDAK